MSKYNTRNTDDSCGNFDDFFINVLKILWSCLAYQENLFSHFWWRLLSSFVLSYVAPIVFYVSMFGYCIILVNMWGRLWLAVYTVAFGYPNKIELLKFHHIFRFVYLR